MNDTWRTEIIRWRGGAPHDEADEVACEEPLEIRVDGRAVSVTMRTPGDDDELALGFLLTEGMIGRADAVAAIEHEPEEGDAGNTVDVRLAPGVSVDFEKLTRHVFASSSCGLCGKTTIASIRQMFPGVNAEVVVTAEVLAALPEKLQQRQANFARTGGLHAAAIFTSAGELLVVREDVGRHNAVDKVLGWAFQAQRIPLVQHILLVSGRSSFEIMQKALAAQIPIVAAVSAPSSLAVQFAQESGQTLVAFLREGGMNVYAGAQRIHFDEP